MHVAEEKSFYEKAGSGYDGMMSNAGFQYFIAKRKEMLVSFRPKDKDSVILDLGCGTGVYRDVFPGYKNLIGMDCSFTALEKYHDKYGQNKLVNSDACAIPLKNESVNIAILFGLVHHLHNKSDLLFSEIRRVLKKDGIVVIDEPNGYNLLWYLVLNSEMGKKIDGGFSRPVSPLSLRKIFKNHDFKIMHERHWALLPPLFLAIKGLRRLDAFLEKTPLKLFSIRFMAVGEKNGS